MTDHVAQDEVERQPLRALFCALRVALTLLFLVRYLRDSVSAPNCPSQGLWQCKSLQ